MPKLHKLYGGKLPIFLFLFVILFPLVSAIPPLNPQQFSEGYVIKIPQTTTLKQYQDYEFQFHVHNISSGVALAGKVVCYFHLYNSSGQHQFEAEDSTASHNLDYTFFILGSNFTELGNGYYYNIYCESPYPKQGTVFFGGFDSVLLTITPVGWEGESFPLFLVLIIISFAIFMLAYLLDSDWLIFLSGILWILTGMYGMIYGIGNLANLYTRGISGIILVTGIVFMIASIINIAGDGNEN